MPKFPAVSICNINPFTTNISEIYIQNILNSYDNNTVDQNMNIRLENHMKMLRIQGEMSKLNDSYKKSFAEPIEKFMISCTFNVKKCNLSDFKWYFDRVYGNCYRFNSVLNNENKEAKTISRIGKDNGLIIEIYLGLSDQIKNTLAYSTGVKVFIHNNSILPNSNEGIELSPGFETLLDVSRTYSQKKPLPYSDCTQEIFNKNSEVYKYAVGSNQIYKQKYKILYSIVYFQN